MCVCVCVCVCVYVCMYVKVEYEERSKEKTKIIYRSNRRPMEKVELQTHNTLFDNREYKHSIILSRHILDLKESKYKKKIYRK